MAPSPHEFLRYSSYLLTIDQVSTDHRPSVDQLLTDTSVKYRRTIGEVSAKSRRSVGEVSVNEKLYRPRHIWKDYRPCLDRVSSDYCPSFDRLSTDYRQLYRPSLDRLSTDCRPTIGRVSTAISTDRSVDTTYSKHDPFFSHTNPSTFECYATMPLLADAHISSLGYLWSSSKFGGRSSKR